MEATVECVCGREMTRNGEVPGFCSLACAMEAQGEVAANHAPERPRAIVCASSQAPALPDACIHCFAPAAGRRRIGSPSPIPLPIPSHTLYVLLRLFVSDRTGVSLRVPVCEACLWRKDLRAYSFIFALVSAISFWCHQTEPGPRTIPVLLAVIAVAFFVVSQLLGRGRTFQSVGLFAPNAREGALGEVYLAFTNHAWGEVVARMNGTKTVRVSDQWVSAVA